jgi:hypothetical protein
MQGSGSTKLPKSGILTAHGEETGEASALTAESNPITVLPNIPAEEDGESRGRFGATGCRGVVGEQPAHIRINGKAPAVSLSLSQMGHEGACEDEVRRRFPLALADGAERLLLEEDVLLEQRRP